MGIERDIMGHLGVSEAAERICGTYLGHWPKHQITMLERRYDYSDFKELAPNGEGGTIAEVYKQSENIVVRFLPNQVVALHVA